jgi:ubiquinone/menaquinone biosynthesis C-methylase UbiE
MNLRTLQKQWNSLSRRDPLRAILARPEKRDVPWDVEEFFQSGILEIEAILQYAESIQPLREKKCALDFGCGVGRLTQALALHFERVYGVDISPAMIEHARNYQGSSSRCEYVLNETSDLRRFPDGRFDFIYSSITLQHMPARFARQYIVEFLRVLNPSGLLVFQLPSRRKGKLAPLRSLAHQILDPVGHSIAPRMMMCGIHKQKVMQMFPQHGGEVLDIASDESAGPSWESFRYLVRRSPRPNSQPRVPSHA